MADTTMHHAEGTPPRTPPRPNANRVNLDDELSQIIQGLGDSELESTSQTTVEVDLRKRKRTEELEGIREVL